MELAEEDVVFVMQDLKDLIVELISMLQLDQLQLLHQFLL